jgi:hypothetical protein
MSENTRISKKELNALIPSKKSAYLNCKLDLELYMPNLNESNAIRKKYLKQVIKNEVFTIKYSEVRVCPFEVDATKKELISVLKTLTDKSLGLIENPKNYPDLTWLRNVVYSKDN